MAMQRMSYQSPEDEALKRRTQPVASQKTTPWIGPGGTAPAITNAPVGPTAVTAPQQMVTMGQPGALVPSRLPTATNVPQGMAPIEPRLLQVAAAVSPVIASLVGSPGLLGAASRMPNPSPSFPTAVGGPSGIQGGVPMPGGKKGGGMGTGGYGTPFSGGKRGYL